jgi:DNA-directed RNA polymerase subunit RPC12/RpoP
MAIANATCKCATCGKEFVIRANKRNTEIARNFEQWAVANITECDECRHKRETAAAAAATAYMPELTGSPKQISWAISIRADFVHQIEHSTDLDETWKAAFDVIAAHKTEAKWWIEHRGMSANLLCTSTVKDEPELLEEIKAAVEPKPQPAEAPAKEPEPQHTAAEIHEYLLNRYPQTHDDHLEFIVHIDRAGRLTNVPSLETSYFTAALPYEALGLNPDCRPDQLTAAITADPKHEFERICNLIANNISHASRKE